MYQIKFYKQCVSWIIRNSIKPFLFLAFTQWNIILMKYYIIENQVTLRRRYGVIIILSEQDQNLLYSSYKLK